MKISKQVFNIIEKSSVDRQSEIGGILGSSNNDVVDDIVIDNAPIETLKACVYYPNIEFFNCKIAEWQKENISFMGMFHTHFAGVKTLSKGDINYINAIMKVMPDFIEFLYFPIYVLPDKKLICYRAIKEFDTVKICEETLHIVS